jgi:DnaA family protein
MAFHGQAVMPMKQIPLAIGPQPLPTFDTFISHHNTAAVNHLRARSTPATPTYLWGPAGCGKSHLLRSLVHERQQVGERAEVFDAQDPAPWLPRDDCTLVIVDRCDMLDAERQQAAFALFVQATDLGAQWVAAGRLPPVDLPLREDLRTRLGWGPVFALQPLGEDQARAVLRQEADRRGVFLSDEVMDYLLTRFTRDLKHLMALLDRLDEFALAEHRAVTVPLLKRMFEEEGAEL